MAKVQVEADDIASAAQAVADFAQTDLGKAMSALAMMEDAAGHLHKELANPHESSALITKFLVPGVWVAWSWGEGVSIDQVFLEEIQAHRHANGSGYLKVSFVPFGADVREVLSRA